ncbi:cell division inhibition protein DicB [Escherichia coli]
MLARLRLMPKECAQ